MARAAKKSKKKQASAKKSAKKVVAKKRATRAEVPVMSAAERRRTLKAPKGYGDLAEKVLVQWELAPKLRVPELSPPRLRSLLRKAERAAAREAQMIADFEKKIAPVTDARLLAEQALWRGVLDVNAAVKLYARSDGALGDEFAFLSEALTTNSGGSTDTTDDAQPTDPQAS